MTWPVRCPICENRGEIARTYHTLTNPIKVVHTRTPCSFGCTPPHGRWSSEPGRLVLLYHRSPFAD